MTLEFYCKEQPVYGATRKLSEEIMKIYSNVNLKISKSFNPGELYNLYGSKDGILEDYDKLWADNVKHNLKCGRKSSSMLHTSLNGYSVNQFIENKFNFAIHPKSFKPMKYSQNKHLEICKMSIAIMLAKYEELYEFEVYFCVIKILFRYFSIYSRSGTTDEIIWNVTMADINSVKNTLMSMELKEFKPYINLTGKEADIFIRHKPEFEHTNKLLPEGPEDIEEVITPGMTQKQKYHALMDAFPGLKSEMTTRRCMAKFGFTRKYNKKNQDKDMDRENLERQVDELTESLIEAEDEIRRLKDRIEYLEKHGSVTEQEEHKEEPETADDEEPVEHIEWNESMLPQEERDKINKLMGQNI